MVVHPEVGKWIIGLGEAVFGMTPFGWRISSAVVGALMVMVMIRLARRVTRSTLLGLVAGLLMCFDGLQLVLSRLALLDLYVAFFVLCAVSCMVADRDWVRGRMARAVPEGTRLAADAWGPLLLWRPWRLATGVMWGLAIGTKWSAVFPLAAFGLLMWVWDAGARRSFGVRRAAVEVRGHRRAARARLRRAGPPAGLPRQLDGVAAARRRLRARAVRHAVRPLLGQLPQARRPRLLPRAVAVAALAVALPPRRLLVPHRTS